MRLSLPVPTPLATTLGAVALAAVLGGCSVSASAGGGYDADELAQQIVDAQQKVTPDLEVGDGSCPGGKDLEEGTVLDCTISIDGVEAPYAATVTSMKDDRADFAFAPAKAIVSTATAEAAIDQQAVDQGLTGASTDCGAAGVIVQDPDTTFTCTLDLGDGTTQELQLQVNDLDGNVSVVSGE